MKMTVAQLLKYKKRLLGRIATVTTDITRYNSFLKIGNTQPEVNVADLIQKRQRMTNHLVEVKTALYNVNKEIQKDIFLMAEKKGEVTMYQGLQTNHGPVQDSYHRENQPQREYVATVRKADVDQKVEELTKEIDEIQERLDGFNHSMKVEIPDFTE